MGKALAYSQLLLWEVVEALGPTITTLHQLVRAVPQVVVLQVTKETGLQEHQVKASVVEHLVALGMQVVAVELAQWALMVVVEVVLLVGLGYLVLFWAQLTGLVAVAVLLVTQKELAMAVVAEAAVADTGLLEDLELETPKE